MGGEHSWLFDVVQYSRCMIRQSFFIIFLFQPVWAAVEASPFFVLQCSCMWFEGAHTRTCLMWFLTEQWCAKLCVANFCLASHGLPLKVDWHLIKAAYMLTCSLGCLSKAVLMYIWMLCSVNCWFCIKYVSLWVADINCVPKRSFANTIVCFEACQGLLSSDLVAYSNKYEPAYT